METKALVDRAVKVVGQGLAVRVVQAERVAEELAVANDRVGLIRNLNRRLQICSDNPTTEPRR